jgi:uncharacterized protein YcgI (DUF1989 family)
VKHVLDQVMPPKEGLALEVRQGQHLRLTQIDGQQVVDLVVWNLDNPREKLSTAYTRIRYFGEPGQGYFPRDRISEGDWLMSTICRPLMTFVRDEQDEKGVHGLHHRMCNRFYYKVFGGTDQDGCFEILARVVEPYGLLPEDIPDSMDVFMNYPHDCEAGHFTIKAPITKPGDFVEFRAEMDVLVGLSNCPGDSIAPVNAGRCKPMRVEVLEDEAYKRTPVLPPDEWLEREVEKRRWLQQ